MVEFETIVPGWYNPRTPHIHVRVAMPGPAKLGFDEQNGARPLQRVIRQKIKRPLADDLLFGRLAGGGPLELDADDEKEEFVFNMPADADAP